MRRRIEASGLPWKVRDRATGIEMVLILPGEFELGSPESESGPSDEERSSVRVRLTRGFYLGATEVTQEQWRQFMGPTPTFFEGDDRPIDPSWDDVRTYLVKASSALLPDIEPLRLPTEAEWEYACRAGTSGPFHFTCPIRQDLVNFNDGVVESAVVVDGQLQVVWARPASPACRMETVPAGSLPPNPWGLHEMHGNLWEWTADRYVPTPHQVDGTLFVDPFEPATGDDPRTLRGGSWYDPPGSCSSTSRDAGGPSTRSNRIGFRVARSL